MNHSKCRVFAILAAVMMTGTLAISAYAANSESIDGDSTMEAHFDEVGVDMSDSDLSVFEAELAPVGTIDPASVAFATDTVAN